MARHDPSGVKYRRGVNDTYLVDLDNADVVTTLGTVRNATAFGPYAWIAMTLDGVQFRRTTSRGSAAQLLVDHHKTERQPR